jgi:sec-independent protein translocase protein TatB
MFDIGWTEMLVIAVVMIVVVGPKDLPRMLRTFGKTTAKLRAMAGDFQKQFNEALKEAELDDVKKSVDELRSLNPASQIRKQLNPFEKAASDVRAGLDAALKPSAASVPAAAAAQAAEPLKNGPTAMPGVAGPDAMPAPPVMTPLNATPADPAVVASAAQTSPARALASVEPSPASNPDKPAAPKRRAKLAAAANPAPPKPATGEAAATRPRTPAKPKRSKEAPASADAPAATKPNEGAA